MIELVLELFVLLCVLAFAAWLAERFPSQVDRMADFMFRDRR